MALISSLGVGSNLDLSGLLDKLTTAEQQPLVAIKARQTSYTAKLTAYGTLQGNLSTFQTAAKKLTDTTLFKGMKAAAGSADVLSASASATSVPGSYAVEVTQLAKAQSLAAAGVASATSAAYQGTISIEFGTLTGGTLNDATGKYGDGVANTSTGTTTYDGAPVFSADASRTKSLTLGSATSLEGLRDAINKATDLGVTASIVNDGGASPYRLVLNSTQTGAASSMRISVTNAADPSNTALQDLLSHDPSYHDASGVASHQLQQTSAASDAALKVNGIAVKSSTNTVKDAIEGATLTLAKTGTSSLTLSRDSESVETAVSAFVDAYNSLKGSASYLGKYDAATKFVGALVGDSTLRNLQTGLRGMLNEPQAGELQVLSKVGVTFQEGGTLSLDKTVLRSALTSSPTSVAEFFAGTTASPGFAAKASTFVDSFSGSDGKLTNATAGIKTTIKTLDTRYAATEVSVQAKLARAKAQFTQLDLAMSRMSSTTSYLTAQFAAMNASKN